MNRTKFVELNNNHTFIATDYFTTKLIDDMKLDTEGGCISMEISRDLIESKDYMYALSFLDSLEKSEIKSDVEIKISVGGYANDERELYEIPEVKEYLEVLFNKHKRAICLTDIETIKIFLIVKCLVEIVSGDDITKNVAIDNKLIYPFIQECLLSLSDLDEMREFSFKMKEILGIKNETNK